MFLFLFLFLFQARLRHAPRFRRLRLPPFPRLNVRPGLLPGLALAAILCLAGWQLARLPGLSLAGPMACTLLVAILYRQLLGYPEALRPGISLAGTKLLRTAIALLGLKLPIEAVLRQGLPLLAGAVATLAFALAASALLRRWLRADAELTMLLAIGTGICGAAAIAAAAPLLGAKEQKTAVGIGLIAAVGTVFALGDALLQPLLPLSGAEYGVWTGLTLHEIAHVAMASAAGGPDALETGMLAKLSRVLLLVPTVFALQALRARHARREPSAANAWRSLPWYLLGFLAMSLLASTGPGDWLPLPAGWEGAASRLTTLLLSVAMAALGLNVDARELRGALRPLAVLLLVSLLLSALAFLAIAL